MTTIHLNFVGAGYFEWLVDIIDGRVFSVGAMFGRTEEK